MLSIRSSLSLYKVELLLPSLNFFSNYWTSIYESATLSVSLIELSWMEVLEERTKGWPRWSLINSDLNLEARCWTPSDVFWSRKENLLSIIEKFNGNLQCRQQWKPISCFDEIFTSNSKEPLSSTSKYTILIITVGCSRNLWISHITVYSSMAVCNNFICSRAISYYAFIGISSFC